MPISTASINNKLYDLLRSRGLDPVPLDSAGKQDIDIENADVFRFEFKDDDSVVGTGWATLEDKEIVLYIDNNLSENDEFLNFMQFVKRWSQRQLIGFKVSNRDHLSSDMKKRTSMKKKEQLGEGYYPMGKKASYNDSVPTVKILLQHTRQIEEGEQRFRNVAKIFVETTNGERFLLPTTRPGLARVYARHIAEGGTPYDDRAKHITTLVEEYTKMAGFVRATRNGQFNESAQRLVTEAVNHYQNLRETLTRMAGHRGYNKYFESYTPVLNEENDDNVSLNELFVQETLDPRIENVLPILNRLSKNITEMSAVKELEEWANTITEVEDETTKTLAEPAEDMLDEAPGAETLAHNQSTEKSNLKAFDLEEKRIGSRKDKDVKPVMSKSGSSALDKAKKDAADTQETNPFFKKIDSKEMEKWGKLLKTGIGISEESEDDMDEGNDIFQKVRKKFRKSAIGRAREHGYSIEEGFSPSEEVADQVEDSLGGSGRITSDDLYRAVEEYQEMMDDPYKLDVDEVVQILMDRFHSKGIMVPDIGEGIEEDLDADQKRAGQLGPTEKVGKNEKNLRGKLVGASESVELDTLKALSGIK